MQDDAALLRDYAETGSETAFAAVVRRHLNLVYSAALRQVGGDAHLAEDVVQSVFRDLARKARTIANVSVLAGWLHTSAHYAAAKVVRAERRRRTREAEAHAMQEILNESAHDAEWARIRPVLDETIRRLRPDDRDAILLRFFEGEAFARIGARLNLTENAARMRVERALEKLREQLQGHGIHSTGAALATVLAGQAVTAAPATLAATITNTALVGAASSGAVVSLFQFMAITKTQAVVAGALLLVGGAVMTVQRQEQADLRREIETLRRQSEQLTRMRTENASLARMAAEIEAMRPAPDEINRLHEEILALQKKQQIATATHKPSASPSSQPRQSAAEKAALNPSDHMPVLRTSAPPLYPAELMKAGISGEATVKIVVDVNGDVQSASIVKSSHRELEAAALNAVRQWKFDPGMKGGRKVNTEIQVPMVFNVEPEDDDWF